jgi:transcriptional regulator with XRE-family HTH domain
VDVQHRLAANLRRLRADRGLSQEAFADVVGIHRTYISDLERASRNPTIRLVDAVAVALGVTASELVK